MRALSILHDGIMERDGSYEKLCAAERAGVLLISDTHGGSSLFSHVIKQKGKECDALVFTGDGAADLIEMVDDEEVSACIPSVIIYVRWNNDCLEYESALLGRVRFPASVECVIARMKVLVKHGHEEGVYYGADKLIYRAREAGAGVAFYGHTHVPYEGSGAVKVINAGSLSYPRRASPGSFAVVNLLYGEVSAVFYTFDKDAAVIPYIPEMYV